eukprot:3383162-Prymnesium_polylepis.2
MFRYERRGTDGALSSHGKVAAGAVARQGTGLTTARNACKVGQSPNECRFFWYHTSTVGDQPQYTLKALVTDAAGAFYECSLSTSLQQLD